MPSLLCKKNMLYINIMINEEDLGTVLMCYFLGFSLKILSCDFFLMDRSVFFKLSSRMTKS